MLILAAIHFVGAASLFGSGCAWLANPWPWDTEECVK